MSPQLDLRIVELLCSRLCHDLVGPIGAVNNGIELLEDFNPEMAGDVLPLITTSARQAWRRLDFFRVAFGFGGGRSWPMEDLRGYATGLLEGGKVALKWPVDSGRATRELEARTGKLLLNLILIGTEGLPRGGELSVAAVPLPSGWRLAVVATGPMTLLHDRVEETLLGRVPSEEVEARTAQAFFTFELARALGGSLSTERQQDRLSLGFSPSA